MGNKLESHSGQVCDCSAKAVDCNLLEKWQFYTHDLTQNIVVWSKIEKVSIKVGVEKP